VRRGRLPVLAAVLMAGAPALAAPPPEGSEDFRELAPYHDWVITRENSLGGRCCDEGDGRPVEAVVEGDRWKVHVTPGHWPKEPDHWVVVPANRVLHEPNPAGVSILWLNPYTHRPQCFLPAAGT
jgi:hypothetical protein